RGWRRGLPLVPSQQVPITLRWSEDDVAANEKSQVDLWGKLQLSTREPSCDGFDGTTKRAGGARIARGGLALRAGPVGSSGADVPDPSGTGRRRGAVRGTDRRGSPIAAAACLGRRLVPLRRRARRSRLADGTRALRLRRPRPRQARAD